ncbi:MAG: class I SAM-dependent methyltransferase [Pseudomonadota bacterium]
MNEQEAYILLAQRLGMPPGAMPFLAEIVRDALIINPMRPETLKPLGRLLELRPGMKILDLACGKAGVSLPLVRTYKVNLTGIDLMPDFIRDCWARAENAGLYEQCRFILGDAARFAAETKGKWDAVFLLGALPSIWEGLETGLEQLKGLVNEGGRLVVGLEYLRPEWDGRFGQGFFSREETQECLSRAGSIVEVFDDGPAGMEAFWASQQKSIDLLREKNPGNGNLLAFLDKWSEEMEWEVKNIGFAVWVLKTR